MNAYQIFDARHTRLLHYNPLIPARNSRKALELYLQSIGTALEFKRSGSNHARFCVTRVTVIDEAVYKVGNVVWYEVTNIGASNEYDNRKAISSSSGSRPYE